MKIYYDVNVTSEYTSYISLAYYYFIATFSVFVRDFPNINFNIFYMDWGSLLKSILQDIKAIFNYNKSDKALMHWEGVDPMDDQSKGSVKNNMHILCMDDQSKDSVKKYKQMFDPVRDSLIINQANASTNQANDQTEPAINYYKREMEKLEEQTKKMSRARASNQANAPRKPEYNNNVEGDNSKTK